MIRRAAPIAGLALLAAAMLAALGVWQIQRRAWKHDLIARIDARVAAPPVALPARAGWPALARDGAYLRVRISGRWAPGAPAFVQAVTDLGPGWWVVQAVAVAGRTVLVNRGFVPQDAPRSPQGASGPVTITGVLRLDEPGGGFLRRNDPPHDRWYSRDITAIARARGWRAPAPFFVDADRIAGAGPIGGLTVVRFADNHLVYALTWFALSGLCLWFAWRIARDGLRRTGNGS